MTDAMSSDVPVGLLRVDRAGLICTANPEAARVLGYTHRDELVGLPLATITSLADRVFLQTYVYPALAAGPREEIRLLLRARTGALVPVLLTARAAPDDALDLAFLGMRLHTVAESDVAQARSDEARAQQRLGAVEAELALAGRLASIGELAAAVAHEINNPLAYVCANVDLFASEEHPAEERAHAIADIQLGLRRIRDIVGSLKKLSRVDAVVHGPVDCTVVIEDALKLASNAIRHRARIEVSCEPGIVALGDEGRLVQVLVNLLINASQALPEARSAENRIAISLRAFPPWVELSVTDNGPGIPLELQERIFEPFFTTKPIGEGTGLGLSVCHGVVTAVGGTIRVESEPGRGARFVVRLPMSSAPAAPRPAPAVAAPAPDLARAHRIFVIDDDEAIVRVLQRVLRGHDVQWFRRGTDAWQRFEADGFAGVDVVLCDLMMPEMSGMDLYDRIAARDPAVSARFLFLTGGAFSAPARAFLERIGRRALAKPFEVKALRAAVAEIAHRA